jgi:hypothetical protein
VPKEILLPVHRARDANVASARSSLRWAWHEAIGYHLLVSTHEAPVPVEHLRDILRDELTRAFTADGPPVLLEDDDQNEGAVIDAAIGMLEVFLDRVPLPERVLRVEEPFSINIYERTTGEVLDVALVGAIDAVVVENGTTKLWELKTAKKKWSRDQIDFDLQPTAYRIAAEQLGYGKPDVTLLVTTKTKTPDVQVEPFVRHAQNEDEFVHTAFGVHRAIEAGVDFRRRDWGCRTCPFADRCGT